MAWVGHAAVGRSISSCFPPETIACRVGVKLDLPLVQKCLKSGQGLSEWVVQPHPCEGATRCPEPQAHLG